MADKKKRRFGNPARQARVDVAEQAKTRAAQAAAVAGAREDKQGGCGPCCD